MRMLRAIEKATRQPIEPMHLPSGEAVTDRRVAQFKQQIIEVVESEDLGFLHQVVSQIENEQDLSAHEIAAAMAFLLQRERPLQLRETREPAAPRTTKAPHDRGRPDTKERRSGKPERARKPSPADTVRYRIEVGRRHEATAGDIVGAIANEAGIDSQFIGQIKLYDDYSTVDLPEGMPQEVFRHLKQVRVRQQKLDIRRDDAGKAGESGRGGDGDKPLKVKTSTAEKSRFHKAKGKPAAAKARRESQPVKEKKRRLLHLPR
jgi:ATP-dependent RNA helicase DeaD